MSYSTGVATSWDGLLFALTDVAAVAGWNWDGSSQVLSKGLCFVRLTTQINTELRVTGGTGVAGGALTGTPVRSDAYCGMRPILSFAWPVTYHIHITTTDVICLINYAVDRWQWIGFGVARTYGLLGTGAWFGGFCGGYKSGSVTIAPSSGGEQEYGTAAAPFWNASGFRYGNFRTGYLHGQLDGVEWLGDGGPALVNQAVRPTLERQPSAWNNESVLLPAQITYGRAESKVSLVAEIMSFRLVRIDYYEPGQIITLGDYKWKMYPFHRKNTSSRDGVIGGDHSGTLGWAIQYDGL